MRAAARRALFLLDEAVKAAKRLGDGADPEALHDFRVSLRRLLTHLKAYAPHLKGAVPSKARRRLAKVFRKTSPIRDAEVHLAWLAAHKPGRGGDLKSGLEWLRSELEERRRRGARDLEERLLVRFWKSEKKLKSALASPARGGGPEGPFAAAAGNVLRKHAARLARGFRAAQDLLDPEATHKLRIGVKKARYLLEPFKERVQEAPAALERLKALQDLLGELHDRNVLAEEVAAAVSATAAASARLVLGRAETAGSGKGREAFWPEKNGLIELARALRSRRELLSEELKGQWLGRAAEALLGELDRLGQALEKPAARVSPPAPGVGTGSKPTGASPRPRGASPGSRAGTPLPS